jgi:hypothetical protein
MEGPLSPELVLVAPPDEAAAARALLPEHPFVAPPPASWRARRNCGAGALAAVYAASLVLTVTPMVLVGIARPVKHVHPQPRVAPR